MTLARQIRDGRYAKGWGPDELAARAAISRTALYQIESGKTETPRAGTLRKIARALEMPIDALLGRAPADGECLAAPLEPGPEPAAEEVDASRAIPMIPAPSRGSDLERKLRELLASPFGEAVARLIEESHRLLPNLRTG